MAKVDLSRKLRMESGDSVNALRMHLQICYQLRHYDLAHAEHRTIKQADPRGESERAFIQKFKQKLDARNSLVLRWATLSIRWVRTSGETQGIAAGIGADRGS